MFGDNLRALRKKKGLSQDDMAERLGILTRTYGSWERSEREPNFDMTKKIAEMFDVSIDSLIGKEERTKKEILRRVQDLKDLPEDQLQKILEYADFIVKSEKKE